MTEKRIIAIVAAEAPVRSLRSNYPQPFAARVAGRHKQQLGEVFGLTIFGVNRTRLEPGAQSALRHWYGKQDEFVYVLEGEAMLITDEGETRLTPGMCAGFKAGVPNGHHIVNRCCHGRRLGVLSHLSSAHALAGPHPVGRTTTRRAAATVRPRPPGNSGKSANWTPSGGNPV